MLDTGTVPVRVAEDTVGVGHGYCPSSIPYGPQLGPGWAKVGPNWAPVGPNWGPVGNAAWVSLSE